MWVSFSLLLYRLLSQKLIWWLSPNVVCLCIQTYVIGIHHSVSTGTQPTQDSSYRQWNMHLRVRASHSGFAFQISFQCIINVHGWCYFLPTGNVSYPTMCKGTTLTLWAASHVNWATHRIPLPHLKTLKPHVIHTYHSIPGDVSSSPLSVWRLSCIHLEHIQCLWKCILWDAAVQALCIDTSPRVLCA